MRGFLAWIGLLSGILPSGPLRADTPLPAAAQLEPRAQEVVVFHDPPSEMPVHGHRYAPVTVDFFCSLADQYYARSVYTLLMELAKRHPHRLRIVYRLVDPIGRSFVAEAALEAFAQGRFHEFIAEILSPMSGQRILKPEDLTAPAEAVGLDAKRLMTALREGSHVAAIVAADRYKRRLRITSRLALVFNGKPTREPARRLSLDDLESAYDEAYARGRDLLDRGVPLSSLYERALLDLDRARPLVAIPRGMVDNPPKDARPKRRVQTPRLVQGAASEVDAHGRGAEHPEVVLALYCSFQSRYCALVQSALERARNTYPELRVVFHHLFDETDPRQPDVRTLHEASLCAEEQGAFWEFFDHVYQNLQGRRRPRRIGEAEIRHIAESIGIQPGAFLSCVKERRHQGDIERALRAARAAGITQTPSVVASGRLYAGGIGEKYLRELIEEELRPGLLELLAPSYLETPPLAR